MCCNIGWKIRLVDSLIGDKIFNVGVWAAWVLYLPMLALGFLLLGIGARHAEDHGMGVE